MKYILVFALLISVNSFAGHICHVEKSRFIWDSDAGRMKVELAKTEGFLVVDQEHQDAFDLDFRMGNGSTWGVVSVSSATHTVDGKRQFHANASVVNESGELAAFLNVYATVGTPFAKALTQMSGEEMPPSISIICKYSN